MMFVVCCKIYLVSCVDACSVHAGLATVGQGGSALKTDDHGRGTGSILQSLSWACKMSAGAKVAPLSMRHTTGEESQNDQSVIVDLANSGPANVVSASTSKGVALPSLSTSVLASKSVRAPAALVAAPTQEEPSSAGGLHGLMGASQAAPLYMCGSPYPFTLECTTL
jgi:hypothetical protein